MKQLPDTVRRMKRDVAVNMRRVLLWMTVVVLLSGNAVPVHAEGSEQPSVSQTTQTSTGEIIVISVPGLSFMEWNETELAAYPHLQRIVHEGAVGAMNIRTPVRGAEDVYASIGLGAPVEASGSLHAYNVWEYVSTGKEHGIAGELFARRTGLPTTNGQLVVPDIISWQAQKGNSADRLGDLLRHAYIPAAAYGNRDRSKAGQPVIDTEFLGRHAPFVIMDKHGRAYGDVSTDLNRSAPDRPYGLRTDYEQLIYKLQQHSAPSLVIIELGDLDRLYDARSYYEIDEFQAWKHVVLTEIDDFIGRLIWEQSEAGQARMLILFSPYVHADAYRAYNRMAPIVVWGGEMESGVLTSATTRRPGVISLYDLAPTLLAQFDLKPVQSMLGAPVASITMKDSMLIVSNMVEQMRKIYALRPPLLYTFVTYEITVLLGLLVFVVYPFRWRERLPRWSRQTIGAAMLLSLLAAPVVLHVMGWAAHLTSGILAASFAVGTVAIAVSAVMISYRLQRHRHLRTGYHSRYVLAAAWIGIVGTALLLADGMTGAEAMKRSILGYDAMVGARYYGIGNEFMGVLIGSTLLAVAAAAQYGAPSGTKRRKAVAIAAALVFIAIFVYLAAPSGGTNAGGALTAAAAFTVLYTRLFTRLWEGRRVLLRLIGACACAGIAGLLLLWCLNVWLPFDASNPSHIGKAMGLLEGGRIDLIAAMVYRKLSMNIHLIGVSSWSKVLIASLLVMIVLLIKPRGVFHRWQHAVPDLMHGFIAIVTGAVTALLVNDSGIVSAATMIVYVAVPMLLLRLQEIYEYDEQEVSDYSANASQSS